MLRREGVDREIETRNFIAFVLVFDPVILYEIEKC